MRNIYIVGVPRSGKTTLSKMIKEKLPDYNIISFEAIRNGFIKSQPNLNMDNRESEARQEILPSFVMEFAHWNKVITSCPCIIEGSFSNMNLVKELMDDEDILICLGFGGRSLEKIVDGIIKYDKEDDYTKNWSREKISHHFYDIEQSDKANYNDCLENHIDYYDTFENRVEIFHNIIESLII